VSFNGNAPNIFQKFANKIAAKINENGPLKVELGDNQSGDLYYEL
jgi:hypothetical protein